MEIIKVQSKLINLERETTLNFDAETKKWYMDTTILKHYNKAKAQGWDQTAEYVYADGSVCGGRFVGPSRAITIRSTEKKQMSEKQLTNFNTSK